MSKNPKLVQTPIAQLVQEIETQLNARVESLDRREIELDTVRDSLAREKVAFETSQLSFLQEKADFELANQEVQAKFNKIRADEELTLALREQGHEIKENERLLKEAQEERKLAEITLEEVAKREHNLSEREKTYEEEIKRKLVSGFFKA